MLVHECCCEIEVPDLTWPVEDSSIDEYFLVDEARMLKDGAG